MRILMAKVRFPRAAQIWITSRCSNTQFFANCSRADASDLSNHFFLNQEVPPAHQAAVGHGVFKLQREETRRLRPNSFENFTAAACMETRNSLATPRIWHGRRSEEKVIANELTLSVNGAEQVVSTAPETP